MLEAAPFLSWLRSLAAAPPLLKVSLFSIAWLLLWLPLAIPTARRLNWKPFQPLAAPQKLPLLASLYLLAPLAVAGVGAVEGTSWADWGLAWQPPLFRSLLVGLTGSLVGLAAVFGAEGALGWIEWRLERCQRLWPAALPLLGVGLSVGLVEESIFRGVWLSWLEQAYPPWGAAAVSSAIFALLHLLWERQETLPQLPGLWLMGLVLSAARWADGGSLGLAWGLHAGWIWGLSALDSAQLMVYTGQAPPWVTGLAGQPLAGIAGLACLLGTGAALWGLS